MTEVKKPRLVFKATAKEAEPGKLRSKYEYVPDPKDDKWKVLKETKDWRRVLSSLYEYPMKLEDLTFSSLEHYLQYKKISLADPKKAFDFTRESETKLGLGSGFEARKKRRLVTLTTLQWREWEEKVLPEAKRKGKEVKFASGVPREVLLATNDAELWSVVPRGAAFRMTRLEEFRESLRKA